VLRTIYLNQKQVAISPFFPTRPLDGNNTGYSEQEVIELMRDYDQKIKQPMTRLLIEYYRVSLNPDIELNGLLLERLGFRACSHCHD
jgi:hypothetical protein